MDYPSDAVPMIAECLNDRYEVYGFIENESVDETDEDRWVQWPLKFRHEDYDNEKGYVLLVDDWGETVSEVEVVCEEYRIYWSWVRRWAEDLFECHFLPWLEEPYFEWTWRHGPGLAARVWSRRALLRAYKLHDARFGGIWNTRYAKLLAAQLVET